MTSTKPTSSPDPLIDELIDHYQFYQGTAYCQIQELAQVLGVKRPTVYNWLKRKGAPSQNKREIIATWLREKKYELQSKEE